MDRPVKRSVNGGAEKMLEGNEPHHNLEATSLTLKTHSTTHFPPFSAPTTIPLTRLPWARVLTIAILKRVRNRRVSIENDGSLLDTHTPLPPHDP